MIANEAELAARTGRLPDMFAARLPAADIEVLRLMADGGEWDELLDILVAVLRRTRAVVSAEERDLLRAVLTGWGLPTDPLEDLAVQT